jgi:stage V sporulation protein R
MPSSGLLFEGSEWNFETLHRAFDAISEVAAKDLGLDTFANQIEIISSEQMLDAYSSIGMPIMYRHWSFGKRFTQHERLYKKGLTGLAYEIVINSNPCITYCLEDNTMALQTLVMAHAAFGHNHFFKNNHLFCQWSDPESILHYLEHARSYLSSCEERYGREEVEKLLDAAHALMPTGVFRNRRPPVRSLKHEEDRRQQRMEQEERAAHHLWSTISHRKSVDEAGEALLERKRELHLPEENLIYFLERFSPILKPWQREVLRIVRTIAQYFYPQRQTNLMNEGCACFVHYYICQALHEKGLLSDGAMLEILHNHTNVLTQPGFDDPRYSGINPYALGFAIMQDIKRVCERPDDEDREWFPEIAGSGDWRGVLKESWANYRDESFIQQFLGPAVMRRFRMFVLSDNAQNPYLEVSDIHDERGFRQIRESLACMVDISMTEPEVHVADVDLLGDRTLQLQFVRRKGRPLDSQTRDATLAHMRRLWGYPVALEEVAG